MTLSKTMPELLLKLLQELESIGIDNEEIYDTVCREKMSDPIWNLFKGIFKKLAQQYHHFLCDSIKDLLYFKIEMLVPTLEEVILMTFLNGEIKMDLMVLVISLELERIQ
jgi:hypothetical protein